MKIPKYWARSAPLPAELRRPDVDISCWRWSDASLSEAQRDADARALELARNVQAGKSLDRYGYGQRPLREEIVHSIPDDAGKEIAVVTRNAYGALILNTARALFMDVDFPNQGQAASGGGLFARLFGKQKPPVDIEGEYLRQVRTWANEHSELGLNVYRTCAGLRCLVTSHTFDPTSAQTIELLRGAGSDPLYVRLCQSQACFRARLTPKPWRCGMSLPPAQYPLASESAEKLFDEWLTEYDQTIREYAVCRPLAHLGPAQTHAEIQLLVDLHDRFACGALDQELA